MKLYNKQLEEIENPERESRIQRIAERNVNFLVKRYGIDESLLRKRLESLAIVEREGKTHFVIYNGELKEIESGAPASFVTKKGLEFDGNKWNFQNAVYTTDNNSDHVIAHELFHFLVENTEMTFDENGIGYDKRGVLITGYDKNEESIDVGLDAKGLNEGITEMLAMQADGMEQPWVYHSQTYLATILANSQNNALVEAHFSEDANKFKEFLEDFDRRQQSTSSKKLVELTTASNGMIDVDLLKGCLEYSLSFCQNMEQLKTERKRLLPVFKAMSMEQGMSIDFSDEDLNLKQFFDEMMNARRQEILGKTKTVQDLGKETLPVQQEILYIDDTQRNMEGKERAIRESSENHQEK